MSDRFYNFEKNNRLPPDNRHKFLIEDHTDEIIVGGTAVHIFKTDFKLSEFCTGFELIYRQGLHNILVKTQDSSNLDIYEDDDSNKTFIKVILSPEETLLFKTGYFRETFSQIKFYLTDGQVIFGEKEKLKVLNTFKPEMSGEPDKLAFRQNFLYEAKYSYLNYLAAYEYFKSKLDNWSGKCSSARYTDWYIRNYDWNYDNNACFVIKTPGNEGFYKTLGVASASEDSLTDSFIKTGKYNDLYKILPFFLLDGINEKGLFCNINVVPNDYGITYGTMPKKELHETLAATMLPRFVLDRFASAQEAITYLKNYTSIYTSAKLRNLNYEIHAMIGDEYETYVIEFINNEIKVIGFTPSDYCDYVLDTIPAITNFFVYNILPDEYGKVKTPFDVKFEGDFENYPSKINKITEFGAGLERWNIIQSSKFGLEDTKTQAKQLAQALYYSNAYKQIKPSEQWYSEFVGHYGESKLTVDSPGYKFEQYVIPIIKEQFKTRNRDAADTWHTVHSSIYNIKERKLYLTAQEGTENHQELEFSLGD